MRRSRAQRRLQLYTAYNRQETDGAESADQFKAGADYADNFTTRQSWYVKDEAGFDHVNDITFYDIAAGGLGYDFIKQKDNETLTGRAGPVLPLRRVLRPGHGRRSARSAPTSGSSTRASSASRS